MSKDFRDALRHSGDCPPVEALIDVMEKGAAGDRAGFRKHVSACAACQTELALYREFEAGEVRNDERADVAFIVDRLRGIPKKESRRTRGFWQGVWPFQWGVPTWMGATAVAIAVILLTVGVVSQWRGQQRHPLSDDEAIRSVAITITSPRGDVKESPHSIEWQPVSGASEYTVTLREVDHTLMFHNKVTSPRLLLPEERRTLLRPGKTVLVQVSASDAAGREIATSGAVSFRVDIGADISK